MPEHALLVFAIFFVGYVLHPSVGGERFLGQPSLGRKPARFVCGESNDRLDVEVIDEAA
jgi:hypothetical protein